MLLAKWEVHNLAKNKVHRKSTGNIHKASYAISALSWAISLQLTPYTKCYTVQPECTNLPVVWISDDCVRKQKSWQGGERKEKRQMKRTKEMEQMVFTCIPTHRSQREGEGELQLTTTCPVDSSGRRCRYAGRCLG